MDEKRIVDAMVQHAKTKMKCILCENMTNNRGLFCPDRPGLAGARKNKWRYVIYPICLEHPKTFETAQKCEDYLLANPF